VDQYNYTVVWSNEDQVFVARVAEFPLLGAHGDTTEEALAELRTVVAEVVAWARQTGEPVPAPHAKGARHVPTK
jgi:predicted RNase H-like HicB family nuclease